MINERDRKILEGEVENWEELGLLDEYQKILENQLIAGKDPEQLKCIVKAVEALNLDGLDEKNKIIKILRFIGSMLTGGDMDAMQTADICFMWAMHYEGKLPKDAYE